MTCAARALKVRFRVVAAARERDDVIDLDRERGPIALHRDLTERIAREYQRAEMISPAPPVVMSSATLSITTIAYRPVTRTIGRVGHRPTIRNRTNSFRSIRHGFKALDENDDRRNTGRRPASENRRRRIDDEDRER